jgi:hypothetical protein
MAVFVSAADESYDAGRFFYGGWAAPVTDWEGVFADAWNERVLAGPPQIPYLHMTDIRDWDWQREHGLTPWEADRRVESAAQVLRSTGSLVPVIWFVDRDDYAGTVRQPFVPAENRKRVPLEPDYILFLYCALTQLDSLYEQYKTELQRVDFWVERNDRISRNMAGFHRSLLSALPYINRPHLVPLVGEFREVGKERIPAQAADVLTWHARNAHRGKLDKAGWRRYWRMTEGGNTARGRFGHRRQIPPDALRQLEERLAQHPSALNRPPYAEDDSETAS